MTPNDYIYIYIYMYVNKANEKKKNIYMYENWIWNSKILLALYNPKSGWLSGTRRVYFFTFKVNSLHKNLTYLYKQQLHQQTARGAEKSSTENLWQAATNPKNGSLDDSGGAYSTCWGIPNRPEYTKSVLVINLPKDIGKAINSIPARG